MSLVDPNTVIKLRRYLEYLATEGIDLERVEKEEAKSRLQVCRADCPHFRTWLQQCKKCGCFMPNKTLLKFDPVESVKQSKKVPVACPVGRW